MLLQEQMIARVRQLCQEDHSVVAAWMYGSFAWGEGDAHSDIEFCIYLEDAAYDAFDPERWVSQVAPVALYFVNEYGTGTAIFENLVRGEFHFERTEELAQVLALREAAAFPPAEKMLLLDRRGELIAHLHSISGPGPDRGGREQIASLWHNTLNWMLFGASVLARGERVRALELLGILHRYLLWLARLSEGTTLHWPIPSRDAEHDLSPEAYARFSACTARLQGSDLERAYGAAWEWAKELSRALAEQRGLDMHKDLIRRLDARFAEVFRNDGTPRPLDG